MSNVVAARARHASRSGFVGLGIGVGSGVGVVSGVSTSGLDSVGGVGVVCCDVIGRCAQDTLPRAVLVWFVRLLDAVGAEIAHASITHNTETIQDNNALRIFFPFLNSGTYFTIKTPQEKVFFRILYCMFDL